MICDVQYFRLDVSWHFPCAFICQLLTRKKAERCDSPFMCASFQKTFFWLQLVATIHPFLVAWECSTLARLKGVVPVEKFAVEQTRLVMWLVA
jgi:hypothetical protein